MFWFRFFVLFCFLGFLFFYFSLSPKFNCSLELFFFATKLKITTWVHQNNKLERFTNIKLIAVVRDTAKNHLEASLKPKRNLAFRGQRSDVWTLPLQGQVLEVRWSSFGKCYFLKALFLKKQGSIGFNKDIFCKCEHQGIIGRDVQAGRTRHIWELGPLKEKVTVEIEKSNKITHHCLYYSHLWDGRGGAWSLRGEKIRSQGSSGDGAGEPDRVAADKVKSSSPIFRKVCGLRGNWGSLLWPFSPVDKIIFKMDSEGNFKPKSPGSCEEEEGSGEEKGNRAF